jgi:hypothetical protein
VLAAIASAPRPGAAQTVRANECCVALLRPTGARALSLGDAITARPAPDGLFANPALLALVTDDQFLVHNLNTSIEKSNTFSLLIHAGRAGGFGLTYRQNDYGKADAFDEFGNPTGTLSVLEHVLTATYATTFALGLSAGLSYELFQFRQDCAGFCQGAAFAATTHILDFGIHFRPAIVPGLDLGLSVVNLGLALQVVNADQASPTPTRLRIGAAYEVLQHTRVDSIARLRLMADLVQPTGFRAPTLNVGAELAFEDALFVRAGHGGGAGVAGGVGIGVGLRFDRFDLGVARSFVSSGLDDTDPFQITFGVRF